MAAQGATAGDDAGPEHANEPEAPSLHVAEYGPAGRPTIVFLHGGGGAGWMWRPQVEALSSDYHLLVPDLPGQGRSTGQRFTMPRAADAIAALIRDRATDGTAHVVGLSEGAQVLIQLLATSCECVETAIVSSALVLPMKASSAMASESVLRWTYRTTMKPLRNVDWWIRWNMSGAAGVPGEYFGDFRESFRTMTEDGFVDLMRANQTFRLPEPTNCDRRVLAVCGAGEYDVMKRSTAAIAAAFPRGEAREVRLTGKRSLAQQHNWNLNEPEVFTRMVRAWIEGTPLPPELVTLQVHG